MHLWQPADSVTIHAHGDARRVHLNTRMRASVLLMTQLLLEPAAPRITHLALGNGIGSGTLALPEAPNTDRQTMLSEFVRVPITTIAYDDLENQQGDTYSDGSRSNRVLVHTEVPLAQASALITEVALFGGYDADEDESGTIFAWSTFPVIDNRAGGDDPEAPKDLVFDWVLKFPFISIEE